MAAEKFSLIKFFQSFTQVLPWIKTLRYMIGAAIIIGVTLFIYQKFTSKTMTNVFKGKVEKVVINQGKRTLVPFVEGYVGQDSKSKMNTGIRAGLRWEF